MVPAPSEWFTRSPRTLGTSRIRWRIECSVHSRSKSLPTVLPSLFLMGVFAFASSGCDDGKKDAAGAKKSEDAKKAEGGDKAPADEAKPAEEAKPALPTETETLALDGDGNEIPATIVAPKGSVIFADTPTSLRIDFSDDSLFGIRVSKANEYNTDLNQLETDMLKNEYGNTNKILEKTETLLRYTMTYDETKTTTHKFSLIITLGEDKWVCTEGNYGGWTEEQSKGQMEACKTLAAK